MRSSEWGGWTFSGWLENFVVTRIRDDDRPWHHGRAGRRQPSFFEMAGLSEGRVHSPSEKLAQGAGNSTTDHPYLGAWAVADLQRFADALVPQMLVPIHSFDTEQFGEFFDNVVRRPALPSRPRLKHFHQTRLVLRRPLGPTARKPDPATTSSASKVTPSAQ